MVEREAVRAALSEGGQNYESYSLQDFSYLGKGTYRRMHRQTRNWGAGGWLS